MKESEKKMTTVYNRKETKGKDRQSQNVKYQWPSMLGKELQKKRTLTNKRNMKSTLKSHFLLTRLLKIHKFENVLRC